MHTPLSKAAGSLNDGASARDAIRQLYARLRNRFSKPRHSTKRQVSERLRSLLSSAECPTTQSEPSFGLLLRERRLAARLTQAALCERAGISPRALQDLERGVRHPHRDTLERLGSALDLGEDVRLALARAATPTPRRRASLTPGPVGVE